jgi:threonyl-tRNA synthetase
VGSFERFIGMLLEHYAGKLPVWLAPVQAVLIGITNDQDDYLKYAHEVLRKNGLRVEIDLRNEKIGFKIREHTLNKIPFMLVAGKSEEQEQTLSVRKTNGEDIGTKHLTDVSAYLAQLVSQKA